MKRLFFPCALGALISCCALAAAALASPPAPAAQPGAQSATLDLGSFGAVGDGVADDGPALQRALDALADAGGGTLAVPAGRFAILTPVAKDFRGKAASVSIRGVPSAINPNPKGSGAEMTVGLGLVSEFVVKTGPDADALIVWGLDTLLISDIVFIGTPEADMDARVPLGLYMIRDAVVRRCEFYGLSTRWAGGAVLHAYLSGLTVEKSVFLGSTGSSAHRVPVILNQAWKSFVMTETIFADYGQRPGYYGKLTVAPFSWVMLGNPAPTDNLSPRREASLRNVFFDEGGFIGVASFPDYYDSSSRPADLIHLSDFRMNVSSLNSYGIYIYRGARNVIAERGEFMLSRAATSAVELVDAGDVILDKLVCGAAADTIRADAKTNRLTVINSTYNRLLSQAQTTKVISSADPDKDPVQYVRQRFLSTLGREADPAASYFWADLLLRCNDVATCLTARRSELSAYLAASPAPAFSLSGRASKDDGSGLAGVTVSLSGSQTVAAAANTSGDYTFAGLPTSGDYTLTPGRVNYTFTPVSQAVGRPAGDRVVNLAGKANRYRITGRLANASGAPVAGATVALSGTETATATTDASGNYTLANLLAGGNYTVTPTRRNYTFAPAARTLNALGSDQAADFTGTLVTYTISGRVTDAGGSALAGATVMLSGAQAATATSDAAGNYSFSVAAGGDYTVTPSRPNYAFTPPSSPLNDLSANSAANFSGALVSYQVSGRVTTGGAALAGVTVTLSDSSVGTAITDASGNYSFSVVAEGDYTITPSHTQYDFTLATRTFTKLSGPQAADFAAALKTYTLSGRVSEDGSGLAGVLVTLSGTESGMVTTGSDGAYSFSVTAHGNYTVTPTLAGRDLAPAGLTFNDLTGDLTADFAAPQKRIISFGAATYGASEADGSVAVTVVRTGDISSAAEVVISAVNGSAVQRADLSPVIGTISFESGEASKSVAVFITDDAYEEGAEQLTLLLGGPVGGTLDELSTATLTIADNDAAPQSANPIDDAQFFVRQHYRDFLGREPDADGLRFWSNQILSCGTDAGCVEEKRINVSAAFFLAIEFQETGYFVHRLYQAAYARAPRHVEEFLLDSRRVGRGLVVNAPGWEQLLEDNKTEFATAFVGRPDFSAAFPLALTPAEFVGRLNERAGAPLAPAEVGAADGEFAGAATSADTGARARALRLVVESDVLRRRELNAAFVVMQYFGYMQRNADEAPDADLTGYNFWHQKLEEHGGDFRAAQMVGSFLVSGEYRARFGR